MGEEDVTIRELVAKIERGAIRLPEMQRKYVWPPVRVRDLLDSLYRRYPSGTILSWKTDEDVPTRKFAVQQDVRPEHYELLLDGQQRLTSLSALMRGEQIMFKNNKTPIDILFNLKHPGQLEVVTEVPDVAPDSDINGEDEDVADATADELKQRFERMTFVVKNDSIASLPHWISVSEVFRNASDTTFLKAAGVTGYDDPRHDEYSKRIQRLRGIADYTYRVNVLDRDKSYEEVTEIFVRVNSLGAKLRSSDLAFAQIAAKWRNSSDIFQEFESACKTKGFELDTGVLLRGLVVFATGQSKFNAVGRLSRSELEENWELAKHGMNFAIDRLTSNMGIESNLLLSSPSLIIAVAYYAHQKNYKIVPDDGDLLRHWALLANAKGRYTRGSSETLLDQDLTSIRNHKDVGELLKLLKAQVGLPKIGETDLENRNKKSAYFKTMFLAFRAARAKDWTDNQLISVRHQTKGHTLQVHHLFPQSLLKKEGLKPPQINDICNLAFISGRSNRSISDQDPSIYLPKILKKPGEKALTAQCVPLDKDLWRLENYEGFLKQRRKLVADRLNEFLDVE